MGESSPQDSVPTILLVDDDTETADLYTKMLSEYTVLTAYSGEEALNLVDETVDVVLLDRQMPTMSGDDVLHAIRSRGLDCRVVMVTAMDPGIDTLDLPFDEYLVKPVSPAQIRNVVSRMLVRSAYDDAFQEMFVIVSKMATAESKMSLEELAASPAYADLESTFTELRSTIKAGHPTESLYTEFTDEKLRSLLG